MTAPPDPVALVTFADPAGAGGVPRALRLLRDGLTQRGHAVTVCACPLAAKVRNTLLRRAWRRIDPSSEEVHRIRRALRELGDAARSATPDTVCLAFEAWTAAACARAGRRTVLRVAGLGAITDEWIRNGFVAAGSRHVPGLRSLEREGFERAARVVALSTAGRAAVAGLGAADSRVIVIPNGVALPPPRRPRARADRMTILCVANLRPVKGVDVLARALAGVPPASRASVRLVHLGGGNATGNRTFEEARGALAAAGVEHEFRGAVSAADVASALAAADVFVLPSRVEMFPNALLEAMAAGLPAVATAVGAVPEILGPENAEAGLLVPPDDEAALGGAIVRLLEHDGLRAERGRANRSRVAERYSLEGTVDAYAALLRDVARETA